MRLLPLILVLGCSPGFRTYPVEAPPIAAGEVPGVTVPDVTPPDETTSTPEETITDDWPLPEFNCSGDATLTFTPPQPTLGNAVTVSITASTGYANVDLDVAQPTGWTLDRGLEINGAGPYTWSWVYRFSEEGRYDVHFTADLGAVSVCTGTVWTYGDEVTGTDPTDPTDPTEPDPGNGDVPPPNPFGIGLVSPGDPNQWDRAEELSGAGGHIKLIFPGMVPGMLGADQAWKDAVQGAYDRDLVPVIRMSPPWGQNEIRGWSDDGDHLDYTSYAASFAAVAADLPMRGDWPLWLEIHNEPNLCYEWECGGTMPGGWLDSADIAAEYASLLRDAHNAIDSIGDSRIKVINGGLAPGGVGACECGTPNYSGGETSDAFIAKMEAEVPGIFASLDGFTSHAYPSSGEGWGFFDTYAASGVGLNWWRTEVIEANVPNHPVLITETGWTTDAGAFGSRQDIATWTVQAWDNDWFNEPQIEAVMPFQLQDGAWDAFSWVDGGNVPYPVFNEVRDWRCAMSFPDPC